MVLVAKTVMKSVKGNCVKARQLDTQKDGGQRVLSSS